MINNKNIKLRSSSIESGFWGITNKFSNTFFAGFITLISSNYITSSEFGKFALISIIVHFFVRIAEAAIPALVIRIDKLEDDILSTCFLLNILNAIFLITILNIFIVNFLQANWTTQQVLILRILSFLILTESVSSLLNSTKQRNFENKFISIFSILADIFSFSFSFFLFLNDFKTWGLVNYLIMRSIIKFLFFILFYRLNFRFCFNFDYVKKIYSFIFPITLGGILEYFNDEYIKIISSLVLSPSDLGILAMSHKIVNTVHSFFKSLNRNVTLPLLSEAKRNNNSKVSHIFLKIRYLISSFALPIFCYLISSNQIVISNLLGQDWKDASRIIFLLSIGSLFITIRYVFYPYLIVKNRLNIKIIFPIIRIIMFSLYIFIFSKISISNIVISFIFIELIISSLSLIMVSKFEKISFYRQICNFAPLIYSSIASIIITTGFNKFFILNTKLDFLFSLLINFFTFFMVFFAIDKKSLGEYQFIFRKTFSEK